MGRRSLQEKDRAGDALKPRRDIDHRRPHGLQAPRGLGEVQQQLVGIGGGQLPGTAPLHGKEQPPSGSSGRQLGGVGGEQPGQGSSAQQGRRLVDPLQRRAQPVGAMAMTDRVRPRVASSRATRAPREYSAVWNWATPNRSSSPSTASARPPPSAPPRGEGGGTSEAGKVDRDDLVVVAQRLTDGLPADHRPSDPMQQDQWLTPSGPMPGKLMGGGRRQAGRDDGSLVGWMALRT
jgi:hypothetical protein